MHRAVARSSLEFAGAYPCENNRGRGGQAPRPLPPCQAQTAWIPPPGPNGLDTPTQAARTRGD
ncbi:MAG: hypothetical protein IJT83_02845, partial [Victivallales bacterium]|nr:hypothetical protein [Victivallales bacterium]